MLELCMTSPTEHHPQYGRCQYHSSYYCWRAFLYCGARDQNQRRYSHAALEGPAVTQPSCCQLQSFSDFADLYCINSVMQVLRSRGPRLRAGAPPGFTAGANQLGYGGRYLYPVCSSSGSPKPSSSRSRLMQEKQLTDLFAWSRS